MEWFSCLLFSIVFYEVIVRITLDGTYKVFDIFFMGAVQVPVSKIKEAS